MSGYILVLWFVLVILNTPLQAAYVVDGLVEGSVCTDYYIFQTCRTVNIDAVKGKDGQLYEIAKKFDYVTEYKEFKDNTALCFIRLKDTGSDDWISWGIRKIASPTFMTKKVENLKLLTQTIFASTAKRQSSKRTTCER